MKKFGYEENGYNRNEVNQFVDEVIQETEKIVTKVKSQQEEIEKLQKELSYYREMKDIMKDAIVRAEESNNKIKKMALEESEILIRDAKDNASRIVNDALKEAQKTENERITIKRNLTAFKKKLRENMQEHIKIVEEINEIEVDNE